MKRLIAFFSVIVLLLWAQAAVADIGLGLKVGTLGIGAEAHYGFSEKFSANLGLNMFSYSHTFTEEGDEPGEIDTDYDADLDLQSIALMANYNPASGWWGGFRLTAGLMLNGNEGSLTAKPTETFDIGDKEYTAEEVGMLRGTIDFNDIAPYIGIGWGHVGGRRWGFTWDLGVMIQGAPKVSLEATGILKDDPTFKSELEKERLDMEEELEPFKYYPVLSIGFLYRF